MFFACDGKPNKPGQIHLLPIVGEDYSAYKPVHPFHRTTAQKSVHVMPIKGFVKPKETIIIDAAQKATVLEHLRSHHGISSETIYNDLYGVIQHQNAHREAYNSLHRGVASAEREEPEKAIQHYNECIRLNSQMGTAYNRRAQAYQDLEEYDSATADYQKALTFNPLNSAIYHNLGIVHAAQNDHHQAIEYYDQALLIEYDEYTHYYRFESLLLLEKWDEAKQAATNKDASWTNIKVLLMFEHGNVSSFEQKHEIQLPRDIVRLLE